MLLELFGVKGKRVSGGLTVEPVKVFFVDFKFKKINFSGKRIRGAFWLVWLGADKLRYKVAKFNKLCGREINRFSMILVLGFGLF